MVPASLNQLDLVFSGATGRTRLTRRLFSWPYTIGHTFHEADFANVIVQSGSGGVIAGDLLGQRLASLEGARARVVERSAMAVHRHRAGLGSSEELHLYAGGRSQLEHLAEPRILFESSRLRQVTVVTIEEATAIFVEAVILHGADAHCDSRFEIHDQTGMLAQEAQRLATDHLPERVPAVGLVVGAGLRHDPGLWGDWHRRHAGTGSYGAASALPNNAGTVARAVAVDGRRLREALSSALESMRRQQPRWAAR